MKEFKTRVILFVCKEFPLLEADRYGSPIFLFISNQSDFQMIT